MQIVKRTMNWLPKASTYDYMQSQAAKRRANHDSYISSQSSLAGSLMGLSTAQSEGVASLAMKAAIARVTAKKA
jgi:hypothetical protein